MLVFDIYAYIHSHSSIHIHTYTILSLLPFFSLFSILLLNSLVEADVSCSSEPTVHYVVFTPASIATE